MMLHRTFEAEIQPRAADAGAAAEPVYAVVCSTDTPVRRGRYEEVLVHEPHAVQLAARSVLLNHDPDQIIGRVVQAELRDGRLYAEIEFAPTARGREAKALVDSGALRGASVGYTIEEYTRSEEQSDRVRVIATRWTWRELSLTPIPADLSAGLQRSEEQLPYHQPSAKKEEIPMTPTTPDWRDEIRAAARALGVSDAGLEACETREAAQALIARRHAEATTAPAPSVSAAPITVGREAAEKAVDEALAGFAAGKRLTDIARQYAARRGQPAQDAADLFDNVRKALVHLDSREVLSNDGAIQYRAVLKSADFGTITQLAAAKAMHDGYMGYEAEYPKWVREVWVPDFNTVTISGLGLSEFAAPPAEDAAYPDVTTEISGGTGANQFLGTNFDVTLTALYNDRANIILQAFRDIGRAGARTLDKITQVALEGASFASATQTLAFSETNLGVAYGAHAGVTIPGIPAKRLIVPMGLYVPAMNATLPAPGAPTGRVLAGSVEVVRGWYLTDPNDWYLAADPADAPVVVLLRHPDYASPRVITKGESGVAAIGFRIDFPAKAVVLNRSTGRPLCAYKCTTT